jgi:hypothetical protein
MRFVMSKMLGGVIRLVVRCTFRSFGRFGNVDNLFCLPHSEGGEAQDPVMGPVFVPLSGKCCPKFSELLVVFRKTSLSFMLIGTCVRK